MRQMSWISNDDDKINDLEEASQVRASVIIIIIIIIIIIYLFKINIKVDSNIYFIIAAITMVNKDFQ